MSRAVYEVPDGPNAGSYVIAQWSDRNATYIADMTREGRRLTGCSQYSSRTLRGIAGSPNVQVYARRSSARAALRRQNGDEAQS